MVLSEFSDMNSKLTASLLYTCTCTCSVHCTCTCTCTCIFLTFWLTCTCTVHVHVHVHVYFLLSDLHVHVHYMYRLIMGFKYSRVTQIMARIVLSSFKWLLKVKRSIYDHSMNELLFKANCTCTCETVRTTIVLHVQRRNVNFYLTPTVHVMYMYSIIGNG